MRHRSRTAFTFVEVLFAIIILGVGMIMIAGVLPVAIKQNSDTRDELTAQAVCESGYAYLLAGIQSAPDAFKSTAPSALPGVDVVGTVEPLNFERVSNDINLRQLPNLQLSRISSADPRFQWNAFYRRDPAVSYLKLIVVATRLRSAESVDRFSAASLSKEGKNVGNGPFRVEVEVVDGGILDPDRIRFVGTSTSGSQRDDWDNLVAASGAFVIISDSPSDGAKKDVNRSSRNNGRVFRLASQNLELDATGRTWDLSSDFSLDPASPGNDALMGTPDDLPDGSMNMSGSYPVGDNPVVNAAGTKAAAWIIGRGRANPTAPMADDTFAGQAQDVSVLQLNVLLP